MKKNGGFSLVEILLVMVFMVLMMISLAAMVAKAGNKSPEISLKKLNQWNEYKVENCRLDKKLIGVTIGQGNYSYTDNVEVYLCADGVEYTVLENLDQKVKRTSDDTLIPTLKIE